MIKKGWIVITIILLISIFSVYSAEVEQKVLNEMKKTGEVSVIVILKEENSTLKNTTEITENQNKVLKNLKIKNNQTLANLKSKKIMAKFNDSYDLKLKHQYSTINAFSGNVTKEVKLDNGLLVQAPIFIKEGEDIIVNTDTGLYSERA